MTQEGIGRGAPAVRSTGQVSFALQSADADGIKEAFVSPPVATTYEGTDLDGALMASGGLADTAARNVVLVLTNVAAGFVAGSIVTVRGMHPYYAGEISEDFEIPTANGNTTLTGAKMFRAGKPLYLDMPVGSRAEVVGTVLPPWNLAPGDTLVISINGEGNQTATFDATVAVADSNSEPFDLDDGDTLALQINGLDPVTVLFEGTPAADVTSGNAEPFAVDNGQTLLVTIDAADETVTLACATAPPVTSGNTEPFVMSGGETLVFDLDGAEQNIAFGAGSFDADEIAAIINLQATGSPASADTGAVILSSPIKGTDSQVHVTGGTAQTVIDFPTGDSTGTGDVADASVATAAELAAAINADCTGSPAADDGGYIVLSTLLEGGTASKVHVTGGTLQTALAFSTDASEGDGNVGSIGAVTSAEVIDLIDAVLVGATVGASTDKVRITNDAPEGKDSAIAVSGDANTAIGFDALTNGTGDVANIDAVTYTEFATVFAADTDAEATTVGEFPGITKPTMVSGDTLQVISGNVATALGLDTDLHKAGGFTLGAGVAREITPPANWIWCNATGTIYGHLRADPSGRIVKCVIPLEGPYPLSLDALHASTDITDLWAVSESE